jgi:hypothetical protein
VVPALVTATFGGGRRGCSHTGSSTPTKRVVPSTRTAGRLSSRDDRTPAADVTGGYVVGPGASGPLAVNAPFEYAQPSLSVRRHVPVIADLRRSVRRFGLL